MNEISIEARLEKLWQKLPAWPLTPFGTVMLAIAVASIVFGYYQWNACLAIRGLL